MTATERFVFEDGLALDNVRDAMIAEIAEEQGVPVDEADYDYGDLKAELFDSLPMMRPPIADDLPEGIRAISTEYLESDSSNLSHASAYYRVEVEAQRDVFERFMREDMGFGDDFDIANHFPGGGQGELGV